MILGNDSKRPKYYLNNGQPEGILVDIMRYFQTESEHALDIRLMPWRRAYQHALNGEGGIIGLSKNRERLALFDYSDVVYYDDILLVVSIGNEFPFESVEDLKGKTIGVERGASYGDEFEKGRHTIFRIDEDNDVVLRLKKLLGGRFDAALIGPGVAGVHAAIRSDPQLLERKDEFRILPKPFCRDPNYLGFAKRMQMGAFLKAFNERLKKGKETGAIQKIIERHDVKPLTQPNDKDRP